MQRVKLCSIIEEIQATTFFILSGTVLTTIPRIHEPFYLSLCVFFVNSNISSNPSESLRLATKVVLIMFVKTGSYDNYFSLLFSYRTTSEI